MERIGDYSILRELAIGGMAEVFLGVRTGADGVGRAYAIKRILPEAQEDPEVVDMLVDEAQLTTQLTHRGIARTVAVERDAEGVLFLVMEFVGGRTLGALLTALKKAGEKLAPELAALVILRASEALDYAHRKTAKTGEPLMVVHRDVSPSNVMISYRGEVRLIDFGIARAAQRVTKTRAGVVKGKLRYMAPEQATSTNVDHRADVYSLGVVLYEALAGAPILPTLTEIDVMLSVMNRQVPPLRSIDPGIPPALARITARAMDPEPKARYPSCAELDSELRAYLATAVGRALGPQDLEAVMRRAFPGDAEQLATLIAC